MSWRSGTLIRRIRDDIDPRGDAERAAFERAQEKAKARAHRAAMDYAWATRPSVLARQRRVSRFVLIDGVLAEKRLPAFLRRQAQ